MTSLLPIHVEHNGFLAIRDGVVLCLFIRKPHVDAAEHVGRLYDRFLEIVGAESVRWYRATDEWKALDDAQRSRLRKLLGPGGKANVRVAVKGGDDPSGELVHGFDYWGAESPRADNTVASFVELRLATEWVMERGPDAFAAIATELAALVPFSSGYASLAFHVAMDVPEWIDTRAFRHPGMDVHANEYTSRDIGELVRGAYWLTFVGPTGLTRVGGAAALRSSLGSGIAVTEVGDGVAIRAGDELRPGDTEERDDLPLTRAVARALEPITLQRTTVFGFTGGDEDEEELFARWLRRHLDAGE
jgi:hypothetical protein